MLCVAYKEDSDLRVWSDFKNSLGRLRKSTDLLLAQDLNDTVATDKQTTTITFK